MIRILLFLLLLPSLSFASAGFVGEAGLGAYSYVGFPTTNGIPNSPTGSWLGYGSSTGGADRIYIREILAADHGAGTADAINVYSHTDPADDFDNTLLCLYIGVNLAGQVDVKSTVSASSWSGYQTLVEESPGSLDYLSTDILYVGFCLDEIAHGSYLGRDSGDSTSGINRYVSTSWANDPPSTISSWTNSGTHGMGIVLRSK